MENEEQKGAPTPDMFGETPVEKPAETQEQKGDDKGGDGKGEKKEEDKGGNGGSEKKDDIKEHPYVKELEKKLNDYGTNLSGQGKLIKELQAKIDGGKGGEGKDGKGEESTALFKDIKTSKELTTEEKEEMTETEIKQFDTIAELQKGMNALADMIAKNSKAEDKGDGKIDLDVVDDLNAEAKTMALEMAKDDVDLANKIINEFNNFAGNDTLDRAGLKERMEKSAKLVPDYKPAKEQQTRKGNTVNSGQGGKKDPFGVDAIVEEAGKGSSGTYQL